MSQSHQIPYSQQMHQMQEKPMNGVAIMQQGLAFPTQQQQQQQPFEQFAGLNSTQQPMQLLHVPQIPLQHMPMQQHMPHQQLNQIASHTSQQNLQQTLHQHHQQQQQHFQNAQKSQQQTTHTSQDSMTTPVKRRRGRPPIKPPTEGVGEANLDLNMSINNASSNSAAVVKQGICSTPLMRIGPDRRKSGSLSVSSYPSSTPRSKRTPKKENATIGGNSNDKIDNKVSKAHFELAHLTQESQIKFKTNTANKNDNNNDWSSPISNASPVSKLSSPMMMGSSPGTSPINANMNYMNKVKLPSNLSQEQTQQQLQQQQQQQHHNHFQQQLQQQHQQLLLQQQAILQQQQHQQKHQQMSLQSQKVFLDLKKQQEAQNAQQISMATAAAAAAGIVPATNQDSNSQFLASDQFMNQLNASLINASNLFEPKSRPVSATKAMSLSDVANARSSPIKENKSKSPEKEQNIIQEKLQLQLQPQSLQPLPKENLKDVSSKLENADQMLNKMRMLQHGFIHQQNTSLTQEHQQKPQKRQNKPTLQEKAESKVYDDYTDISEVTMNSESSEPRERNTNSAAEAFRNATNAFSSDRQKTERKANSTSNLISSSSSNNFKSNSLEIDTSSTDHTLLSMTTPRTPTISTQFSSVLNSSPMYTHWYSQTPQNLRSKSFNGLSSKNMDNLTNFENVPKTPNEKRSKELSVVPEHENESDQMVISSSTVLDSAKSTSSASSSSSLSKRKRTVEEIANTLKSKLKRSHTLATIPTSSQIDADQSSNYKVIAVEDTQDSNGLKSPISGHAPYVDEINNTDDQVERSQNVQHNNNVQNNNDGSHVNTDENSFESAYNVAVEIDSDGKANIQFSSKSQHTKNGNAIVSSIQSLTPMSSPFHHNRNERKIPSLNNALSYVVPTQNFNRMSLVSSDSKFSGKIVSKGKALEDNVFSEEEKQIVFDKNAKENHDAIISKGIKKITSSASIIRSPEVASSQLQYKSNYAIPLAPMTPQQNAGGLFRSISVPGIKVGAGIDPFVAGFSSNEMDVPPIFISQQTPKTPSTLQNSFFNIEEFGNICGSGEIPTPSAIFTPGFGFRFADVDNFETDHIDFVTTINRKDIGTNEHDGVEEEKEDEEGHDDAENRDARCTSLKSPKSNLPHPSSSFDSRSQKLILNDIKSGRHNKHKKQINNSITEDPNKHNNDARFALQALLDEA
ncbi:hypothetical protein B5S33_g4025 [[Candida] boidinii]|nr:hypothetical protein B5S30_g230 [[Candida] boidinii]OWB85360.1 hypothetical protein B5S33_g4025 [[Candida] boidinii]